MEECGKYGRDTYRGGSDGVETGGATTIGGRGGGGVSSLEGLVKESAMSLCCAFISTMSYIISVISP